MVEVGVGRWPSNEPRDMDIGYRIAGINFRNEKFVFCFVNLNEKGYVP